MADLPPELWLQIFQHLDVKDLCSGATVCRYWNHIICDTEPLWKVLCGTLDVKQDMILNDKEQGHSWKEVYQMNYGSNAVKRQWQNGCFSNFTGYKDIPGKVMCTMDVKSWGEIFQQEMER